MTLKKRIKKLYAKLRFKIIQHRQGTKPAIKDYLRKYMYVTKMAAIEPRTPPKKNLGRPASEIFWTMWLQDTKPQIIQLCLDTITSTHPETIIITEKNMSEYIDVPDHVMKAFKSGAMGAAHFSDYVRMALLDMYGGTWLDASCLLVKPVPEFILKQKFFILQNPNKVDVSSFFIHAQAGNYMIKCLRIFLEEYWRHEDRAIDYFFMHNFISLICAKCQRCHFIWMSQVPYINSHVKYFSSFLYYDADADLWKYLANNGFMYKVHHRSEPAKQNPNSWYYFLLNLYNTGALPIRQRAAVPQFKSVF